MDVEVKLQSRGTEDRRHIHRLCPVSDFDSLGRELREHAVGSCATWDAPAQALQVAGLQSVSMHGPRPRHSQYGRWRLRLPGGFHEGLGDCGFCPVYDRGVGIASRCDDRPFSRSAFIARPRRTGSPTLRHGPTRAPVAYIDTPPRNHRGILLGGRRRARVIGAIRIAAHPFGA